MSIDQEAVRRLRRGLARDLDGHFEKLVLTFQQPLFVYALRMTGSRQDAEELVQDALMRAYRALRTYDHNRIEAMALQAWLYRICINLVRNRGRRRPLAMEELNENGHHPSGLHYDPVVEGVQRDEVARELAGMVGKLPHRYRSAIVLRFVNDLSYAEMADALQQPEGTVKSNVHRGLNVLRKLMNEPLGAETWGRGTT